ncbi:hypothetical protein, partial [Escherichia coli]|uniref:hypothetical protein n=1 Tax=Escherichia coli TaxID=562 RepID=UPI003CFBE509
ANTTYTLCSLTGSSSVCGRIRKAASQSKTAAYLFQVTSSGAVFEIWVSCDNASGGTSKALKKRIQYAGESYSLPASEVGPCTIGV